MLASSLLLRILAHSGSYRSPQRPKTASAASLAALYKDTCIDTAKVGNVANIGVGQTKNA